MKMISRVAFLYLAVLCLLPCIAIAQQESTSPTTATVYIYRLRDAYGAVLKPSVFCDGKQLVRMRNGRVAVVQIQTGSHNFTSTFPGSGLSLDIKAGESYYMRVDMTKATFMHAARGQLTEVLPGQGKFETSQLKPAEDEDLKAEAAVASK